MRFAAYQLVIQGIGIATGVLLVRALNVTDYGLYAILTIAMSATVTISDAGITSGILVVGGRVHRSVKLMGKLWGSARYIRTIYVLLLLCVALPCTFALLARNGARSTEGALLALSLGGLVLLTTTASVMKVLLELRGDYLRLQRRRLFSTTLRLVLTLFCLLDEGSGLVVAQLALLLGALTEIFLYRHLLHGQEVHRSGSSKVIVGLLARDTRRVLPYAVTSVAAGQYLNLLLAGSGATTVLADLTALSRFPILFSIASLTLNGYVVSFVARRRGPAKGILLFLLKLWLPYIAALILISALLIGASPLLLSILGPRYQNAEETFAILALGAAAYEAAAGLGALAQARGWNSFAWLLLPLTIAWATIMITAVDWSSLRGAAVVVSLNFVPVLFVNIARVAAGWLSGSRRASAGYGSTKVSR